MQTHELVLSEPGGLDRRYLVTEKGLVIGRASDTDITLTDQRVSRRHAQVSLVENTVRVADLGSRNGLLINGEPKQEAELREGDELQVGETVFRLACYAEGGGSQTKISYEQGAQLAEEITAGPGNEHLPVLYKAARLLGSVFDTDDLLAQILDLLFEALPVKRAFVLTLNANKGEPVVRASRSREGETGGPPLSNTLVQHVLAERTAIHTVDAMEDSRFDGAVSIFAQQIHAAMCAPLVGRDAVAGAVYVDSGGSGKRFSENDFQLFTAIAYVVGVSVENARLHQEKVAQERLAAIGQATAGLGHCMKNILTGIKGGAEYVDMAIREGDMKYVERAWPIMGRAMQRIETLVMNLLTYSRDRVPECMPTNLNQLVRDVFETMRGRADRYNVALELEDDPEGTLSVDAQQIYRVLMNLVTNAIDACEPKGGTVTVTLQNEAGGVSITVSDTGGGIPPAVRNRLGQAFVSTKGSAGTGLGLAVSYKLVREHGGEIDVESEPGKGTAFTVYLPRCSEEPGAPPSSNTLVPEV
ncbi:MAG: ATP-binding protein [Candidatus Hydrogenedentota bacterium]